MNLARTLERGQDLVNIAQTLGQVDLGKQHSYVGF